MRGKHVVILLKISDLREQEIPKIGLIELEDEETGEQSLVNTSNPVFQKKIHRDCIKQ